MMLFSASAKNRGKDSGGVLAVCEVFLNADIWREEDAEHSPYL
jgi:hypothetical protein